MRKRYCAIAILLVVLTIGCERGDDSNSPMLDNLPSVIITDPKLAEAAIVLDANAAREQHGKPSLQQDAQLQALARAYSEQMAEQGFFGHVTPDGQTLADRFERFGISYRVIGENLARFEGEFVSIPIDEVVAGWLNSPGHRANLLDEANHGFTHTGVGIAARPTPQTDRVAYYYTQLFLRR